MEVMEAKERLPKETKGKRKEKNPALDEGKSVLNKEETEEEDFLQPYLHLLPPSLIELFRLCEITRVRNTYLTREVVLLEKHIIELQAFKDWHNDKPFTLTHCWTIINDCPKFKDQYRELQRKRGKKTAKFAGGGDGEALKMPRGKTNSKVDDIRDAASMALHETLHGMMSQKEMRDEKKRQSKDKQMKQYLELQWKKIEMEEAAKKRKIDLEEAARQRQLDIEAANVEARKRQFDIKATNAATKAKEVALAIVSVDLTKMREKTRSWFEARQKEMFDADGLN
ncbi:Serine/threonine-protein kinase mph1 [Hordeum vulgare]|nr:Serine/threonine-protein kinase mph1 [Hordeum vulgare]